MLARRALAALAATILAGTAAAAVAPAATAADRDACRGLKVERVDDTLRLTLAKGCERIDLNISTYDVSSDYDGSGRRNNSAYPMRFRENKRVMLDHEHADTVVYIDVSKCGWGAYDVYTGNVVEHPSTKGRDGFLSGAIVHHARCPRPDGRPTSAEGKPTATDRPTASAPADVPGGSVTATATVAASTSPAATASTGTGTGAPTTPGTTSEATSDTDDVTAAGGSGPEATVRGVALAADESAGFLPRTGTTLVPVAGTALALLGAGLLLVRAGRVRRVGRH